MTDDITRLVCQKLQRFADCAEDGDGCDIGRDWFDALTLLGLLERTKRNPAEWTMTPAGHDTLAQQGKAWPAIVQHCVATEAVTPDESDPHGTIRRLIDYHVEMDREQGKAGGVAVYEVQERMSSFAPSSCWTETTRETYEGGYFPETLFHRRILYATPPTHIPDAGDMVSANPPEAGVTDGMVERARAAYYDAASVDDGVFTDPVAMRAALTAALAPQPKDAT